jgi:hypothetical protein
MAERVGVLEPTVTVATPSKTETLSIAHHQLFAPM